MTIDRYTKAVLTIIAGCLLWICVTSAGVPLGAQMRFAASTNTTVQPVVIVGTGTLDRSGTVTFDYSRGRTEWSLPVTLAYTDAKPLPVGLPYSASNPLPAQLSYTPARPMPVELAAVRKTGEWEAIRTREDDAATRRMPGNGGR